MSDIEPPARPIAKLPALAASGAPALVTALGERASYRFLEFFTANIRNPHTRRAYARAARENVRWRTRRCSASVRHGDFRLARPQPLGCME